MFKPESSGKELFEGKRLTKIGYSNKPLPLADEIQYLSVEEFEKKFNFTYTESLYGKREELKLYSFVIKDVSFPKSITSEVIKYRMQNPLDCFVICNLGPTGHGIFTTKAIDANTVLFIYSGEIYEGTAQSGSYDYTLHMGDDLLSKAITAKNRGGLSRFMQHLPIDDEKFRRELKRDFLKREDIRAAILKGFDLDKHVDKIMSNYHFDRDLSKNVFRKQSVRNRVQDSNVKITQITLDGMPLIVCWVEEGVKANTQLGFCYGSAYWEILNQQPRYYKDDGTLIPLSEYTYCPNSLLMKDLNPLTLYQEGVKFQNEGKHESALAPLSRALMVFRNKKGKYSLECGNCYAALASVYRDSHDYPNALLACKKAIAIFSTLNEEGKLDSIRKKYQAILALTAPKTFAP